MKIKSGALAGQLSGSVGSLTASRNRYGAYLRARTIPINPATAYQLAQRARLAAASKLWRGRPDDIKKAWEAWAATHPITDAFGDRQILSGAAALTQINLRRLLYGSSLDDAIPVAAPPTALATLSAAASAGGSTVAITFTDTPLGAGKALHIMGCVVSSGGIAFVKNKLRFVGFSGAAQASPYAAGAAWETRLGALVENQTLHLLVAVYDSSTGLLSPPLRTSCVVAA